MELSKPLILEAIDLERKICAAGDLVICEAYGNSLNETGEKEAALAEDLRICALDSKLGGIGAAFALKTKGELSKAYSLATKGCLAEHGDCSVVLRYFPHSPDLQLILTKTEEQCMTEGGQGATACMLLGAYELKNGDDVMALKTFEFDCTKGNLTGCQAGAALSFKKGNKKEAKEKFLAKLCSGEPDRIGYDDTKARTLVCATIHSGREPASSDWSYFTDLLRSYMDEQQ